MAEQFSASTAGRPGHFQYEVMMPAKRSYEPVPLYGRIVADRGLRSRYLRISKWRTGLLRELQGLVADQRAAVAHGSTEEARILGGMLSELGAPLMESNLIRGNDD